MAENHENLYKAAKLISDNGIDQERISAAVSEMLAAFGENTEREGLRNTPRLCTLFLQTRLRYASLS